MQVEIRLCDFGILGHIYAYSSVVVKTDFCLPDQQTVKLKFESVWIF